MQTNKYTVLIEHEDPFGVTRAQGDIVRLTPSEATKLLKRGLIALDEDLTSMLVDLRADGQIIGLFNTITGERVGEVSPAGIKGILTGNLIGESFGQHYGDVQGNVAGNLNGINIGPVTTYAADGDISVNDRMALLDGVTATCTMALADGLPGQQMVIKAVDVTNACSVAPANLADGALITFTDQYAAVTLVFDGASWAIAGTYLTVAVT